MTTVLSTKKLKENQRSLLLHTNVFLITYNAIEIDFITFEAPKHIENAIFTSQNAVKYFLKKECHPERSRKIFDNCFCVGEKTKTLLEEKGQKVVKTAEYASELAAFIVENHKNSTFYFFCGNLRSNEIPSKLKHNNISFEEIQVYKTSLNTKKFKRKFDAILFFSPSGVRSYCIENKINESKVICIGKTTAAEAKKYTKNVSIANTKTVESVIAKAVEILNWH